MSCCESSAAEDVLVLEGGWTGYVPPSRDDGDRYLQTWNGNIKRVTKRAILSLSLYRYQQFIRSPANMQSYKSRA